MLNELIDKIPYKPIKEHLYKYLNKDNLIDENKSLKLFHAPWMGTEAYNFIIFGPAKDAYIRKYEQDIVKIPDFYRSFLKIINGCFMYEISLYGLTPSIYENNLLDRSAAQCHDLGTANKIWINEYEIADSYFHFGGRCYSETENSGYFYNEDQNEIFAVLNDGSVVFKSNDLNEFLKNELFEAEKMMLNDMREH